MKARLVALYARELFNPGPLGILINPFYIIRRGLYRGVRRHASALRGRLMDFGCGEKPYRDLFQVDEYIGVDVEAAASGHGTAMSQVDVVYDGRHIPFPDAHFDSVLASEALEHVFEPDAILTEIARVTKPGGHLLLTVPFVWDEHEVPYDYGRYTSFGITHLLQRNGFRVLHLEKNSNYVETLFQMWNAYVFQHILPRRTLLKVVLTPVLIAPFTLLGLLLGAILPRHRGFYLNNIVLAQREPG